MHLIWIKINRIIKLWSIDLNTSISLSFFVCRAVVYRTQAPVFQCCRPHPWHRSAVWVAWRLAVRPCVHPPSSLVAGRRKRAPTFYSKSDPEWWGSCFETADYSTYDHLHRHNFRQVLILWSVCLSFPFFSLFLPYSISSFRGNEHCAYSICIRICHREVLSRSRLSFKPITGRLKTGYFLISYQD